MSKILIENSCFVTHMDATVEFMKGLKLTLAKVKNMLWFLTCKKEVELSFVIVLEELSFVVVLEELSFIVVLGELSFVVVCNGFKFVMCIL